MLRVVFMGTPEFAVPTLAAIAAAGHQVAAVYTQPPRPAGRGMQERKSAIHQFADAAGIRVLTPRTLKADNQQQAFAGLKADVAVVVAYGLILPETGSRCAAPGLPEPARVGPAALARRGPDPARHHRRRHRDGGDCDAHGRGAGYRAGLPGGTLSIGPDMTAGELHDPAGGPRRRPDGARAGQLEQGALGCAPQPATGATYAAKIDKGETGIDFSRPAHEVHNHVRGLSPVPGAWFDLATGDGKRERIRVLRTTLADGAGPAGTVLDGALTIACGAGAVRLLELQRAGKRPMPAAEFLRGYPVRPGLRLSAAH